MICPEKILICNIADTPPLCDYYLEELSQRPWKLRFRPTENHLQLPSDCASFFEVIPEDINAMVENLNEYRKTLKGNFEESSKMNEITATLKGL
jgi:precorrin-2 dehydrogenase/sirohydrochlorin ferrochelatase